MKTPVDPVIRIQRRSVDELRITITTELTRLTDIEHRASAIDADVEEQYRAAAVDWALSAHAFARRRLIDRARLEAERDNVLAGLDRLRAEAADAYGRLKAAEQAAQHFRDEAAQVAARTEQAAADDTALQRHAASNRAAQKDRER